MSAESCRTALGTASVIVEADYPLRELSARSFAVLELIDPELAEHLLLAVDSECLKGSVLHYKAGLQYRPSFLKYTRCRR